MIEVTYKCPDSYAWAILKISNPSGEFTLERTLMRGDVFTTSIPDCVEIMTVFPSSFPGEPDFYVPSS